MEMGAKGVNSTRRRSSPASRMTCDRARRGVRSVLAIVKTKSDAESIALANDCDFGLGSNVFTKSTKRAEKLGPNSKPV